ncbi:MAG TPA: flagellar basal body P-ring protein FlgI [Desulfovibrio sp.]|jgi:flagellar P-ring protein precursor FlgI|uniref:flagellar basal body P-ring protein FlgI n=1 Tax=Desulfovibrio sp. TaxID=885 RepID=UPI002A3A937D|nr:flagellar basal body P-ring protein FlgI [Desulfovibrio sp.]MDY0306999.1 flagellar basal body P-ring protein FlgI [Desulfovibrionaceae bacterium]HMM37875.1 flagellar basal body P-ring protein FlgI [Desulfovibrio sp.]
MNASHERMSFFRPGRQVAVLVLAALLCAALVAPALAVRLKDIATFSGVRTNELVGYGLVVGLSGTGDGTSSAFTVRSMVNMLDKMGVQVDPTKIKPKNVAAVMVTSKMSAAAKPGSNLDVAVSSLGDAKSLLGGVLLLTPLKGVDGQIYALAQGPLTIGGFSASGEAATAQKNIATVGRIPNGAVVERGVPFKFNSQESMTLSLNNGDFSTVMQVVNRINSSLGGGYAKAQDASTIELSVPDRFRGNMVPLMASLENLDVSPDARARVVVDEKTGTVVVGNDVRLSRVAVAHGNLQIVISESQQVSQPGPFSQGRTVTTPQTNVSVNEQNNRLMLVEGATLQELVDGLNSIGATPRDLISIIRTLKSAGALHADLEVI